MGEETHKKAEQPIVSRFLVERFSGKNENRLHSIRSFTVTDTAAIEVGA